MFKKQKTLIPILALLGTIGIPSTASATPFQFGPLVRPCDVGFEVCFLPGPNETPGKEYSNHRDVNDLQPIPGLDPEQNLAWDGVGGRNDTFDYSGSRAGDNDPNRDVDSLANIFDLYFPEVVADEVWLLFSTETDNRIFYENPGTPTGDIWATPQQIDIDMATIDPNPGIQGTLPTDMDIDGLEVWGFDGPAADDANRYSLRGDPFNRVSVWEYDQFTNTSTPIYTKDDIANAIGLSNFADFIDLDGLMSNGLEILFSVAPIDLDGDGIITNNAADIDGGEIWVWDGVNAATFLFHGGHLWDTAFDVIGTYGTATENINALEAVAAGIDIPPATPEPGSVLSLLTLGSLGAGSMLKRKLSK